IRSSDGIAVAVFTGVIDLDGNTRQALEHELAGQRGMPACPASGDVDLFDIAELSFADLHLFQEDLASILRYPSQCGVADGAWLLVNLLKHEVLKAALFRHDGVPGDVLHLAFNGVAIKVRELYTLLRNHRKVAVGQKEDLPCVSENRRDVRGDEVLVIADSYHSRRPIARGHDLVRLALTDHT